MPRRTHRFQLEWLGDAPARVFRKDRPGVDAMPWGTLNLSRFARTEVLQARARWTDAARTSYKGATARAQLLSALLESGAPLDLVTTATDLVADGILHVDLAARVAVELGNGAPPDLDFTALDTPKVRGITPIQRTGELMVRTCWVDAAFGVSTLEGCAVSGRQMLTRTVLAHIKRDLEAHRRAARAVLTWAEPRWDAQERDRLAEVAMDALQRHAPFKVRSVPRDDVLAPLSRYGIRPSRERVEALLA